ncbi:DNA polymerase III delta subunit [Williamsia limnetica]|uniref:DNA-directed DNA polymerase n=2 Tax=Williamsia limnetica TaxID=882452 RepID=A0A318RM42_WILLI|nr:DNA polymerase III delta subunit [Williamsia limnetica]
MVRGAVSPVSGTMTTVNSVHLVLGDDEFLAERATGGIVAAVRATVSNPEDIPVTRLRAGDATAPELAELLSPSLFAEDRIIVLEAAAEAGKEPAKLVAEVAVEPPEGVTLIIVHSGGGRAKSMVGALRKTGVEEHDCASLKGSARADFVRNELRRHGVKAGPDVIEKILDSVRADLRELASACSQLAADTDGKVDVAAVARYYSGRPEITGFEVADKAVTGDRAGALESLQWAHHHGVAHVLLADALAEAVHSIARVRGVGRMDQYAAASELGMPPWKVKKVQGQASAWDSDSIAKAMSVVATLNGEVKGQAADADYSLQRAVAAVADLRPSRRR